MKLEKRFPSECAVLLARYLFGLARLNIAPAPTISSS